MNESDVDVVIPCRTGVNHELKWALRSIDANLPHRNLWLINAAPIWYRGLLYQIPDPKDKHHATDRALSSVVENDAISERFIWSNDDIYIMQPWDGRAVFHRGTIDEVIAIYTAAGISSHYTTGMANTRDYLRGLGIDEPLSYELHAPMPMTKAGVVEMMRHKEAAGIALHKRTLYGNLNYNNVATYLEDAKVYQSEVWRKMLNRGQEYINGLPFLSSEDSVFFVIEQHLKNQGWARARGEG